MQGGACEALIDGWDVRWWTVTEWGRARGWDASSKALTRFMAAERRKLNHRGMPVPRWVAVPELQKRGAVHWHGLIAAPAGVLGETAWRNLRTIHDRAVDFGFGFQADVQVVQTGREGARAAGYIAKYATKDARLGETHSGRYRRIRSSVGPHRWCDLATVTECAKDLEVARMVRQLAAVASSALGVPEAA